MLRRWFITKVQFIPVTPFICLDGVYVLSYFKWFALFLNIMEPDSICLVLKAP